MQTNNNVIPFQAQPKDQEQTPSWIFDIICKYLGFSRDHFFDPFLFQKDWNIRTHYDAFTALWRRDQINFCNPPYTQVAATIFKALIEFMNGCSSVLLIPKDCLGKTEGSLKKSLIDKWGIVEKIHAAEF